jgi:hypothetical protein
MKKILLFVLFLFSISYSFSQLSLNASGNTFVTGTSSVSYTLGQIDFSYIGNSTTIIFLGVQQPGLPSGTPKIITLDGVEPEQNLVFTAYPNPTFDNIKIHLSSIGTIYNYFLFDTSGKLIKEGNFKDNESIISLENFPTATYFLKVISEKGFEKNIKIIKNEK